MKVSDRPTETFIFMADGNTVKVVMDFDRKVCTVYSDRGRVLLKLEKMTSVRMAELRGKINKHINGKKGIHGYRSFSFL